MKNDRCCGKCRTPWSVCAKQRACPCHVSSHLRDELEGNFNPAPNPTPKPAANVTPLFQEPTP